jgi:peptidoglycan/xylan/chitin deacetylase (PgdA/CDA1 family)
MRFFRPGFIAVWLYSEAIFRINTTEKLLCLTFDDGPDPDSTPRLLDILDEYCIKAMFFCNGKAAEKYPDLITRMIAKGHQIGNHGYNHYDGWRTSLNSYVADASYAARFTSSCLFRPPYGHLLPDQYRKLRRNYRIVFWDIMPYDFDNLFGSDNSLRKLKNKIRPGSIICLHDNSHSSANKILNEFITFSTNVGYRFDIPVF